MIKHEYIDETAYNNMDVITTVISNNHLNLLKYLVQKGHVIALYDVVIAISTSNAKVIKYVLSYFKPRLYSKGFCELLLSLTMLRRSRKIYSYVDERLK